MQCINGLHLLSLRIPWEVIVSELHLSNSDMM